MDKKFLQRATENGKQSHYTVILKNPAQIGLVTAHYTTVSNTLIVETTNIKEIKVDCRSIAKEKQEEILNSKYDDNTNAYKQYFIDKELFNVIVDADTYIKLTLLYVCQV